MVDYTERDSILNKINKFRKEHHSTFIGQRGVYEDVDGTDSRQLKIYYSVDELVDLEWEGDGMLFKTNGENKPVARGINQRLKSIGMNDPQKYIIKGLTAYTEDAKISSDFTKF